MLRKNCIAVEAVASGMEEAPGVCCSVSLHYNAIYWILFLSTRASNMGCQLVLGVLYVGLVRTYLTVCCFFLYDSKLVRTIVSPIEDCQKRDEVFQENIVCG